MPLRAIRTAKGKYQIDGFVEGERVRRRFSARSQLEADEKTHQIESDYRRQIIHGPDSVVTFHHAAAKYVEAGGQGLYLPRLMKYFKNVKAIKLITGEQIREAAKVIYPDAAPATRNRQVIAPASAVINYAHGHGWCGPIRVKTFSVKTVERPYADIDWLLAFRAHAVTPEIRALATFMFCTGARVGEAIKLTAADVDFDAGTATLRDTKNGEDRVAQLPAALVDELRRIADFVAEGDAQQNRKNDGFCQLPIFSFHHRQGHRKQWAKTIAAAGIERLTAHEAGRHAFGKYAHDMLESSLDAATAGGWKSRQLFEQRYAHAGGKGRSVADAMNAELNTPKIRRVK